MQVRVLLFGPLADAAGADAINVELQANRTCEALLNELASREGIGPLVPACRLAINHGFAAPRQELQETDEVALIGLVSGG